MSWHLRAVMLPDDTEPVDRWLTSAGWVSSPVGDAEELPGAFALPGLVDAHSHVSLSIGPTGPEFCDRSAAQEHRAHHARDGVSLLRDVGGAPEIVLSLRAEPGMPSIIAAGRHLAPPGQFFEGAHRPVTPDQLLQIAVDEIAQGAGWVKVIADFPPRTEREAGRIEPLQTYSLDLIAELVAAVHARGARVAAHVTTPLATELVQIGVDSIEHGTQLDEAAIATMSEKHIAWTPTLCAVTAADATASDERRRLVAERTDRLRHQIPLAVERGVPVLTGTDVVGSVPREVAMLVDFGLSPVDALRCATTTARAYLSPDTEAESASVVTYAADPRNDPAVLASPAAVVIDGTRIV